MPFVIDQTVDVAAPPAIVWRVITDLPRYGEWNPFVVSCHSELAVGDPITMWVNLVPGIVQPQRETILEYSSDARHLCYGIGIGVLASRRCHDVFEEGGRTKYRSYFELSGWLAPLVWTLFGTRLEKGFESMTVALRGRAESQAAAAR